MKLSDKEKRVLAGAELHANENAAELAQRLGMGINSVRYALRELQRWETIKRVPFVNLYPLGFTDFVVFFSVSSKHGAEKVESGMKALENNNHVTWLAELGGQYQYGVAIFVRDIAEFVSFLSYLTKIFEGMTIKKSVRMSKRFHRYNRTYLDPSIPKESLSFGVVDGAEVRFDETDEKILLAMSNKPTFPVSYHAKHLGIPISTWHSRIRRLKENGVYSGDLFAIDTTELGYVLYNLHVYTNGLYGELEEKLRAWADTHPNVVHFIECIASWDFEIGIEVESPQQITKISRELYETFGNDISQVETIPLFHNRKYTFFRPVLKRFSA